MSVAFTVRGWTFEVHEMLDEADDGSQLSLFVVRARWSDSARNRYEFEEGFKSREAAEACLLAAVRAMAKAPRLTPSQSPRWHLVRPDGERVGQQALPLYATAVMPAL